MTTPSDIYSCLAYDDAPAAIEWLCRAFGFTKRLVVTGDDGSVLHSELSLGTGVIMVSSAKSDRSQVGPRSLGGSVNQSICVFVEDPDAHFAQAVAAGFEVTRPLRDEEYGSRGYQGKDIEGHLWYFGNYRPGAYWDGGGTDGGSQ